MKRILIISMNYEPEVTGIAPYVRDLANHLAKEGQVEVVTTFPHYPNWKFFAGFRGFTTKSTLSNVHVTRLRHFVPSPPSGLRRFFSEVSFGLRVLFAKLPTSDIVILLSPALVSTAISILRIKIFRPKLETVIWIQDIYSLGLSETNQGGKVTQKFFHALEKWTLNRASHVVVIHERFKHLIHREFAVSESKISAIRNWSHIDGLDISSIVDRSFFGWGTKQFVVLHTGNMGRKQGLSNVIAAARLSKKRDLPILFVFMGNGSEFEHLLKLANGLTNVQFIDTVSDNHYRQALRLADLLLVSQSSGVVDMAVPSKLTSYFQSGTPVIAAVEQEGITAGEIRLAKAGIVVEPDQPDQLLKCIVRMSSMHEELKIFGTQAKKYSEDTMSKQASLLKWSLIVKKIIDWS